MAGCDDGGRGLDGRRRGKIAGEEGVGGGGLEGGFTGIGGGGG